MIYLLIFAFLCGYAISLANILGNSSSTGDRLISPKNLPLIVGNPTKLELEVKEASNSEGRIQVKAQTASGLTLAFFRDSKLTRPETQIRISKKGWVGYLVFNFEGPVIRSMLLGNGQPIPPERLRGETRALAGRLFQRLYELGLNATRELQPRSG